MEGQSVELKSALNGPWGFESELGELRVVIIGRGLVQEPPHWRFCRLLVVLSDVLVRAKNTSALCLGFMHK